MIISWSGNPPPSTVPHTLTTPGSPSALTATSVPATLLNNVQFMQMLVVFNLSHWNLVERATCIKTKVSELYFIEVIDKLAIYQNKANDPLASEPDIL